MIQTLLKLIEDSIGKTKVQERTNNLPKIWQQTQKLNF